MRTTFILLAMIVTSGVALAALPPQAPEVEDPPVQAPVELSEEVASVPQAPATRDDRWLSPEAMPEGAEWFWGSKITQSIFVLDDGVTRWNQIEPVKVRELEAKWHVSGGMLGLAGWRSDKFRTLPAGEVVSTEVRYVPVLNSSGSYQSNKAITRSYPVGTRFDDILSRDGEVFEHRARRKELFDGKARWVSEVLYENPAARPEGYAGLSVSCSSCHREAGTGKYGAGLVPGGDTVISDPLDWGVWTED